jgi:predicted dehydrogenase
VADRDDYALVSGAAAEVAAPQIDYRPPRPARQHPIALVGAGGISFAHLDAYRTHGFHVAAILSRDADKARARRDEFFPDAEVMTDYAALLSRRDIEVIDLTPHPAERLPLMEAALKAGKHVLSQKPFVASLDDGEQLVALAKANGVQLAVNQNGRWAPHMAWMRGAVRAGRVGQVAGVHASLHWDHRWIRGTPFERMEDVVLFDFGVHWFDFVTSIMGRPAGQVTARSVASPATGIGVPMMASAILDFGDAQASLVFDAAVPAGPMDLTYIAGSAGSLRSSGPDLGQQQVELYTAAGVARPVLEGKWFNDGFAGAMGALLVAIETGQAPENSAEGNLASLANAFAALASARTGQPVRPGEARGRYG